MWVATNFFSFRGLTIIVRVRILVNAAETKRFRERDTETDRT